MLPPVNYLFDLNPIVLEAEPPRRFIGLVTGVALNFDEKRFHSKSENLPCTKPLLRCNREAFHALKNLPERRDA